MNIRKYLIALTALMLALLPAACGAQQQPSGDLPELVIGSDDYRPYNYLDENGQAAGVDVALATEACRRMGYEPVFRQISWDEKDLLLESGQVDCLWGCFSMNGRENTYLWAGPYLYSDQVVAVRADSDIYTLADLADRRVAVQVSSKAESILSDPADARIPQLRALYCLVDMDQVATALRKYYVDACASHAEALAGALERPAYPTAFWMSRCCTPSWAWPSPPMATPPCGTCWPRRWRTWKPTAPQSASLRPSGWAPTPH